MSSISASAQSGSTSPGVFEKAFEYYDGIAKQVGVLKNVRQTEDHLILTFDVDGIMNIISSEDKVIWGYRDNDGNEFRYFSGELYRIAMKGPIMLYSNFNSTVLKDENGDIKKIESSHIYISNGPNNPIESIAKTSSLIKLDYSISNSLVAERINEVEAIILYNRKNQ